MRHVKPNFLIYRWFGFFNLLLKRRTAQWAKGILWFGMAAFVFALPTRGIGGSTWLASVQQLVALEIRFELPEAGEVFLVWGIAGWQLAPEEQRPEGTVVENGVMLTPMVREGDKFVVRLHLPSWTSVSYGFLVTKAADGSVVNAYEGDGVSDFQSVISQLDSVAEIQSKLVLSADQPSAGFSDAQLIAQEIRYQMPEAGEVMLVWGINGWGLVPQDIRPAGTVVENAVMKTPMTKKVDAFAITLEIPAGSTIDFGFLITGNREGAVVNTWEADGSEDFHRIATGEVIEVQTTLPAGQILGILPDAPLTIQEIRYRMPQASEVFLIWGINGWNVAPEVLRPAGTVLADQVMRSPMSKERGWFIAELEVAVGTTIDFGFLITRDSSGSEVAIWEANGDEDFHHIVSKDGNFEVESALASHSAGRVSPALFVGLIVIAGLAIVIFVGWIFNRK